MKTLALALVGGLAASAALAGNSDRYSDPRFDTRTGHVADTQNQKAAQHTIDRRTPSFTLVTRKAKKNQPSYPYANPLGVGPYNDSR